MLSLKEWLCLLLFYLLYLLVGGFLFKAIEAPNECENVEPQVNPQIQKLINIVDKYQSGHISASELQKALVDGNWSEFSEEAGNLTKLTNLVQDGDPCKELDWNFYNSLFFSFTVMSTIGKFHKQNTGTPVWI